MRQSLSVTHSNERTHTCDISHSCVKFGNGVETGLKGHFCLFKGISGVPDFVVWANRCGSGNKDERSFSESATISKSGFKGIWRIDPCCLI